MYQRVERVLVWNTNVDISNYGDFLTYHDMVSPTASLKRRGINPWLITVAIPAALWLIGAALSAAHGLLTDFLGNVFPYVFAGDLFLVLVTLIWLDRRGRQVVIDIRDVFDTTDEDYYSFIAQMVQRIYEPLAPVTWPSNKYVHRPTAIAYVLGTVGFLWIPYLWWPTRLSNMIGTDWAVLPVVLQGYYVGVYLVVLGVGVLVGWIVAVGVVFMGSRIRHFDIQLDVTRKSFRLGLEPYTRMVLIAAMAYLVELVVSSLFVLQTRDIVLLVGYGIMTMIPVVGMIGGHYGLYRAIRDSKRRRLADYRSEYDNTIEYWFLNGPTKSAAPSQPLEPFVTAKREIEELPDWPFNSQVVIRLVVAVIASNVSIILRFMLIR